MIRALGYNPLCMIQWKYSSSLPGLINFITVRYFQIFVQYSKYNKLEFTSTIVWIDPILPLRLNRVELRQCVNDWSELDPLLWAIASSSRNRPKSSGVLNDNEVRSASSMKDSTKVVTPSILIKVNTKGWLILKFKITGVKTSSLLTLTQLLKYLLLSETRKMAIL